MISLIILVILGVVFQGIAMFRSGVMYDYGVGYWGPLARDGIWHEALVNQLIKKVPPQNPGFSGNTLVDYHYFYDLLVSLISRFGVDHNFLIYRFFPVVFSILLGVGTYKLAYILFKNKKTALLSVFFVYFGSSFGWMVSLIKNGELAGESAFWANQPVSMNLNPPFAISLLIIIFTTILVGSYFKKPTLKKSFGIVLLSGTLIGFKVYAGLILLAGLLILSVKRILVEKDYKFLIITLVSLAISSSIFFSQIGDTSGLIKIQPLWLVDSMIDAGDRVGIPNFTARRFAYLADHRWLFYIGLEAICLFIFLIGNLGTRIIGVLSFKKKQLKKDVFLLIFAMMFVSLVPPLIFVQEGNPWNIVQFFYYLLFFTSLFSAKALEKLPIMLTVVILLITPISSAATFRSWLYKNPPAFVPKKEVEALSFLRGEKDGVVLKHPFDISLRGKFKDPYPILSYADNSYVSAYSGMGVYIEDLEQQTILNTDYKDRLDGANRFFEDKDTNWSNTFLKDEGINYVYLPKVYSLPMAEGEYNMKKIFENDEVNIYKVLE